MNSDLLPPTSKTSQNTPAQPPNNQAQPLDSPNQESNDSQNPKEQSKLFSLKRLKGLPVSVYILMTLVGLTVILLTIVALLPQKGSQTTPAISTDNILEPQISIPNLAETKQTPFYGEIVQFQKDSTELDYNYPTYNLPVIETDVELTK